MLGLIGLLRAAGGPRLLDVQWSTPHLASLGAVEITRAEYHRRLDAALAAARGGLARAARRTPASG